MANDTNKEFEQVLAICRELFSKKLYDYGASWRIMRPQSLTDQIFIKAKRIRTLETGAENLVGEDINSELIGIVNYGIIALVQLDLGYSDHCDITPDEAMAEVGAVVEGYYATASVWELARRQKVDMPIVSAAHAVLYDGISTAQVVTTLMQRSRKTEAEFTGWDE